MSLMLITEPGTHALAANQRGTIHVAADDVVLDLGDFSVIGPGTSSTTEVGIYIEKDRRNVIVRNGTVSGFLYGVRNDGAEHVTIERLMLIGNTFRGVGTAGNHTVVRDCLIANIGGTTVFDDSFAIGIEVQADHAVITNNVICEVYPVGSGEGVGLSLSLLDMPSSLIERNRISNIRLSETGRTFGIWSANASMICNNVIINQTYGMSEGFRVCENTIGNVIIGEQCIGGLYSTEPLGLDTTFIPLPGQAPCLDCLDAALAAFDPRDRYSAFRLAQIYEKTMVYRQAFNYFRLAASLGSAEAERRAAKLAASHAL